MEVQAPDFDSACLKFKAMRNCAPFRFSGVWFVAMIDDNTYRAYRTKRAAMNAPGTQSGLPVWKMEL